MIHVPDKAKVILTSEDKYIRLHELISLLLSISMNDENLSVEYWVGIKKA